MTRKTVHQEKKFFGLSCFAGRKSCAAVFLALFLLGYNLTLAEIQQSSAVQPPPMPMGAMTPPTQVTPTAPSAPTHGFCPQNGGGTCEPPGSAMAEYLYLFQGDRQYLINETQMLESWMALSVPAILQSEYDQIDWLERSMIDWWNTMWYYNLLPSYQQMTRQLNVELALQTLQLQENADASAIQETDRALAKHEIKDQELHPGEQVCVAATTDGGFTRAMAFDRAMRQAWEMKSLAAGLNETVDPDGNSYPGATSAAGSDLQRYQDWQNIFCDKNGFSTSRVPCGKSPDTNLTNADVLPVKYLFNNLTINVDDQTTAPNGGTEGQNLELAVEYLINNLVGLPAMDAVVPTALATPAGEAGYLMRRSYLARYAAIRSVPDMVAGWRMPGSTQNGAAATSCGQTNGIAKFVCDLRESAQVPADMVEDSNNNNSGLVLAGGISKNPSYKELMHALSIDRFNSGRYATQMITDPAKVNLEKLDISVFYLMQLRDYYELLERTALTLAVQVSVMTDQQAGQPANMAVPLPPAPPPGG